MVWWHQAMDNVKRLWWS